MQAFHTLGLVALTGVLLIFLQTILVPFVLAVFLGYLVRPFAEWISRTLPRGFFWRRRARRADEAEREEAESLLPKAGAPRGAKNPFEEAAAQVEAAAPRWVGVLLAMALAVALVASVILLMAASISSLGSRLDAYQHRARDLWDGLVRFLRPLGLDLSREVLVPSKAISSSVAPLLNAGLGVLSDFVMVLIFLVFLLLEPTHRKTSLRQRIDDSIARYLLIKSAICLAMATFTFLTLSLLDFPLPLFLAIATYILTFIPNLGPLVASALPLPIALLDMTVSPYAAAGAVLVPALAHAIIGNFVEPQLFGKQFRMSPVVILFSLGVWWILWGVIGAMLAVPLTSVLRIVTSDLVGNGIGGSYVQLLNQLLEGLPLDFALLGISPEPDDDDEPPRAAAGGGYGYGRPDSEAAEAFLGAAEGGGLGKGV